MRKLLAIFLVLILVLPAAAQDEGRVLPYDALIRSAKIYLGQKQKDYETAKLRLQEAIDNYENPVEAYYYMGLIHSEKAEYKQMVAAFAKVKEICAWADENEDKDLRKRCDKDDMFDLMEDVITSEWEKSFKHGVDRLKMADSLSNEAKNEPNDSVRAATEKTVNAFLESSEGEFETCIMLDSTRYRVWTNMAIVQNQLGNTEKAAEDYQRAYDLNPKDPDILSGYANTLYNLKRFDEAAKFYNLEAEVDTVNAVWAYTYAAMCYQYLKQRDKLKETLDRILDIEPNSPEILYQRGIYYIQEAAAPELRDSMKLLDSLATLHPKDKALEKAREDMTAYRLNFYTLALPDFKAAAEADTTAPEYRYWYATAAFFSDDVDLAREVYESCVSLDPDFTDCWCGLESIYARLSLKKEFEEAKEKCGD